jgi:host factor-I protein
MNKTQMNLQDNFLNQVRKDNVPVTIYLVSGVQLKGHVRGFDSFTVVLESPGKPSQLVYKHAMASVVPARPISTAPPRDDRDRDREREERPRGPEPEPAPEVEAEPAAEPEAEAEAQPEPEPEPEPQAEE